MKKIISLVLLAAIFTTMACNNSPAETKEVIVVPQAAPVIIEKTAPPKGTTITLDKKGVKVETKKIDVSVKNQ